MQSKYKILIVEDDNTIAEKIKGHLEKWAYDVYIAENFSDILKEVSDFSPDLILLDITLPYYNGFYWCTEIRKLFKIPIIFISSANDNMNIIMAMDMGGDDFIAKPFDLTVLTAKVGAIIRRSYSYAGQVNVIEKDGAILNLLDGTLSYNGQKAEFSKNEFQILALLMENEGSVVSRDTIMMNLWDSDNFIDDNTLTVNVTRIRKKLKDIGLEDFVKTKKGIGYMI
ncbi:response regulator transcription factor [uncultured Eubacterium sp.]|uniref:response regulator transcription factor n=1 Tax=uncultured Eubacterium sp. TaxID=165185 RepID=UPI002672ADA4|nr:response regulator transcription factor [uncultured Eubacterium sp.]